MLSENRKATLHAIHTDAVNKAVKDQKMNMVLDNLPHPINDSEKDLTSKERATLAQLRSGYYKLLGSYKSRIKKDASLNLLLFAFRDLWKEWGDSNFKIFFTELPVPPQAAGVVGTFNVLDIYPSEHYGLSFF